MNSLLNIVGLTVLVALVIATTSTHAVPGPQNRADDSFLNIPDEKIVFNDRSALANRANLQSKVYSEFIHKLYRYDADNLQKFDTLTHQV